MDLSDEMKRRITTAVAHCISGDTTDTFPGVLYHVMRDVRIDERGGNEGIRFEREDGAVFWLVHSQDCCESVGIHDIVGDLGDLVGSPILLAEESSNKAESDEVSASGTWTFYKFATLKGYVDIWFLGESNGYYSEGVDFITEPRERT